MPAPTDGVRIPDLTNSLLATTVATDDLRVIVDTSANETKKIRQDQELEAGLRTSTGPLTYNGTAITSTAPLIGTTLNLSGNASALFLLGNGYTLDHLNAANLTGNTPLGSLALLLAANNTFSGDQTANRWIGCHTGNGSQLSCLAAGNLAGNVALGSLALLLAANNTFAGNQTANNWIGRHSGNGAQLSCLTAGNIGNFTTVPFTADSNITWDGGLRTIQFNTEGVKRVVLTENTSQGSGFEVSVYGSLYVNGTSNLSDAYVDDLTVNNDLNCDGNIYGQALYIQGTSYFYDDLDVTGTINVGEVQCDGYVYIGGNTYHHGNVTFNPTDTTFLVGNTTVANFKQLTVYGGYTYLQTTYVAGELHVDNYSYFADDLYVAGQLKVAGTLYAYGIVQCSDYVYAAGFYVNDTSAGISSNGEFKFEALADAAAANNTAYYSSDAGKLVYKDSGGVVHNLY